MKSVLAASLIVAALSGLSPSAVANEFYRGKTLTCVVPYPAGGATDTFFRTVLPYVKKHTAGNPQILVQNMAGAGGIMGNNHVYDLARPDGLTALCAPWLSVAQAAKSEGVRFDYTKMKLVGAHRAVNTVLVATALVNDPAEITSKPFVLGGLVPSSSIDLRTRIALDMIGAKYRYVAGFAGDAPRMPALHRGEIHMIPQNFGTYLANYKKSLGPEGDRILRPLWYYPSFDSSGNPVSIPEAEKDGFERFDLVYARAKGAAPSGEIWEMFKWFENISNTISLSMWLPERAPDQALEALRDGWNRVVDDPEFRAEYRTRFGDEPIIWASEEDKKSALDALRNAPDNYIAHIRTMIESGGR